MQFMFDYCNKITKKILVSCLWKTKKDIYLQLI